MEKQKPFFMVFVEGEHGPTHKHTSIESAQFEAQRLTTLTQKPSYVLASIKSITLPAKYIIGDLRPETDLPF